MRSNCTNTHIHADFIKPPWVYICVIKRATLGEVIAMDGNMLVKKFRQIQLFQHAALALVCFWFAGRVIKMSTTATKPKIATTKTPTKAVSGVLSQIYLHVFHMRLCGGHIIL